jgi:hypothetical protein
MRIIPILEKSLLPICALAVPMCLGAQHLSSLPLALQQPSALEDGRVQDAEQRTGPFAIAGQNYTVVLHEKRLPSAGDPIFSQTLAGVEISDTTGIVSYQKAFAYVMEQGRFHQNLSASVEQVSGKTGAGLMIHYREQTAASEAGTTQIDESWQLFGLVNGKLAALGKPAPIGVPAAGGPFMGVMMRAANGTVSVISQPDTIEVRAWTGYFYVFIPLRVDWNHGGLAQGQRCMEMIGGGLKEEGCDMRVEADRKPSAEEFGFVRLLPEAHENPEAAEHAVVQKNSRVEILGSRAITIWNENGELIWPTFSDIWLHVRIDDQTGWIHGEEDFAAVGLPARNPAP